MINLRDFGAVADGKTLCTKAFADAIKACKQAGEALLVPAGKYYTGTINLDGVSMHLESGARIIGSSNPEDYPAQEYVHNEMGPLRALIVCLHGENVVLDGDGTIDLNGTSFYDFDRPIIPETLVPLTPEEMSCCNYHWNWRPAQCIFFLNIHGLVIRGLRILNAPCWTFSINQCENVLMTDLDINTSLNIPNDDGIHICCCDGVIIRSCHITSGDDCIALSCITDWNRPCRNITISDCVLRSCSKAIVIGYQFSVIQNVVISNVIIRESNRGLCFMCDSAGGMVEHVRCDNMFIDTAIRPGHWWGNGEAVFMEAIPSSMCIPTDQNPHRETPVNYYDIALSNITCTSENAIGAVGTGDNFRDVVFRDMHVDIKAPKHLHLKGHTFDTAPSPEPVEIPDGCAVFTKGAKLDLNNIIVRKYDGTIPTIQQAD